MMPICPALLLTMHSILTVCQETYGNTFDLHQDINVDNALDIYIVNRLPVIIELTEVSMTKSCISIHACML